MPTKIVVDCATGQQEEVELAGDELAAHEALLDAPAPEPVPLVDAVIAEIERRKE